MLPLSWHWSHVCMGTLKRRGVLSVLVVLPDGSRSLIPASWTDWKMTGKHKSLAQTHERCIATLADLLHARVIVDALLSRCPIRQPTHEESRNAADAELSPGLPSTKRTQHQSRPRNACRSRPGSRAHDRPGFRSKQTKGNDQ